MKRNTRTAFKALERIGAPVYDRKEGRAEFILGAELRTADDHYFADYYHVEIREQVDSSGKVINAFGIRQDVIDILDRHGLWAEWINPGMVGIYQK